MSSVTYKHQPAIDKTNGSVPLAGTSHLYTVTKVLWSDSIQEFLETLLIGKSLHVCCGMSLLGDYRLDLDISNKPAIIADASRLCFAEDSFDTVLCDPPYNGKFQWNHDMLSELSRIASRRIIFQHWFIPATKDGLYKKAHEKFELTQPYVWQGQTYFGRAQIISVFDRRLCEDKMSCL